MELHLPINSLPRETQVLESVAPATVKSQLLSSVIRATHQKCLEFRALDRIVQTIRFAEALKYDPNNLSLHEALASGNVIFVERWIDTTLKKEIGELSIRELREMAKRLGITFYSSYSKDALMVEVLRVTEAKKTAS